MNLLNEPLFRAVFDTAIPRVVVKVDKPNFSVVHCNDAQNHISSQGYSGVPNTVWEAFSFSSATEGNGLLLMTALQQAVASNKIVFTPAFKQDTPANAGNNNAPWWQIEVQPVSSKKGKKPSCLLLITHQVGAQSASNVAAMPNKGVQEQQWNKELAAANEELAASNEELVASNDKLIRSQTALQALNDELEQRVLRRTQALVESEARFKNLVQHAPVAIIVLTGPNMIIDFANDNMLKMWNKTSEVIGKPLLKVQPQMEKHRAFRLIKRVYTTGKGYSGHEIKGTVHRNGKMIDGYYDALYQPLKGDNNQVAGIMAVITDVTKQVHARHELDRAYEQTRLAKQAAQLGMFDLNLLEGTMEWDDRCRKLFGISHHRRVTYEKDFWEGLHPDDKERVSLAIDRAFNKQVSGGDYDVQYRTIGAEDNKERWIRAKGKVLFDEQDTPVRFIGSVLEITEQKKEEQRKNDFIGIVSHELKTPLTSIKAYIQLLSKKLQQDTDAANALLLSKAENQVNKMTAMIKSFLDVSRLESGKIHIEPEDFCIDILIAEVIADVQSITPGYPIIFSPQKSVWVCADREKISHVLQNILSNAIKYSPAGSAIQVACTTQKGLALVSIRDEGIGIAKEDLDKLFDRYYRVQNPNMKTISGFGIGLYLSAEIIKLHNGKIWAESKDGKGATFYFTLPEKCV